MLKEKYDFPKIFMIYSFYYLFQENNIFKMSSRIQYTRTELINNKFEVQKLRTPGYLKMNFNLGRGSPRFPQKAKLKIKGQL